MIRVQGLIKNPFDRKALSSLTMTWCSVPPGKISRSELLFNFFNILLSGLPWNPLGQSRANPSYTNVAFLDFNMRLGCLKGVGACQELNITAILRIICDGRVKKREKEREREKGLSEKDGRSLLSSCLAKQASWAPSPSISPTLQPYGGFDAWALGRSCPLGVFFFFFFLWVLTFNFPVSHNHSNLQSNKYNPVGLQDIPRQLSLTLNEQNGDLAKVYINVKLNSS